MIRLSPELEQRLTNRLTEAPPRQPLEVTRIDESNGDMARLRAMGVCDGRSIELVRAGDPLIVRVMGSRIGISRRLADQIQVLHG
jgi:Fe2+ transport system protein FeoA